MHPLRYSINLLKAVDPLHYLFRSKYHSVFQAYFIDETVNTTANIRIYNEAEKNRKSILAKRDTASSKWIVVQNQKPKDELNKVKNGYQIIAALEKDSRVSGVSPFLGSQAIFKVGIAQIAGRVSGVDIIKENILFDVSKNMRQVNLQVHHQE